MEGIMRHSRWLGALATLAILAVFSPLLADAGPAPQKGVQRLRLITFTVDPATVAAQARGFNAAEGLDVEFTVTPNSTAQMQGLADGTYDVASTAFDNVLGWSGRDGGPEIVAVLQTNAGVLLPMYARPEIHDWSDLKGKPLAVDAVDTAFALVLRRILLAHDLDLDRGDYSLVTLGSTAARLESMGRGDTFAGIVSAESAAQAEAAGLHLMADHREVLPDYPGGVFAVTRPWAQQHRAEVVGFLRAWLAANRWVHANPTAAIELTMAERGLNREAASRAMDDLSPDGALNAPGLASVLGLRTQFRLTPPMGADVARYFDVSYYSQAMGAPGAR
jgi:ABC-type nitrate/sulfonate/bicarbonate transport system substrate-binding protein